MGSLTKGSMDGCKDWRECGDEGRPTLACFLLVIIISMSVSSNPLRLYPVLYLPSRRLGEPKFLKAVLELEFFDGEALATALAAAEISDLAKRMRKGMGNLEVAKFADELLREAEEWADVYDESKPLPDKSGQRGEGPEPDGTEGKSFSTYGELYAGMRDAATWYEQVAEVECAVEPSC